MSYRSTRHKNIEILTPTGVSADKIKKAVDFLYKKDAKLGKKVSKNLSRIVIVKDNAPYNVTLVEDSTWIVGQAFIKDASYPFEYIASLLLHEAHHVAQYRAGHKYHGTKAETAAYKLQRKFLLKIGYDNAVEWLDDQYKTKWWTKMDKMTSTHNKFLKTIESL